MFRSENHRVSTDFGVSKGFEEKMTELVRNLELVRNSKRKSQSQ